MQTVIESPQILPKVNWRGDRGLRRLYENLEQLREATGQMPSAAVNTVADEVDAFDAFLDDTSIRPARSAAAKRA